MTTRCKHKLKGIRGADAVRELTLNPGEQKALVSKLSKNDLNEIDEVLLSNATSQWRKVAMIVGMTMGELSIRTIEIPDIFYSQRIRKLVEDGSLESQGNLQRMRYSEVRLPTV